MNLPIIENKNPIIYQTYEDYLKDKKRHGEVEITFNVTSPVLLPI